MPVETRTFIAYCFACDFQDMVQEQYPCHHNGDQPSEEQRREMLKNARERLQYAHNANPECQSKISVC